MNQCHNLGPLIAGLNYAYFCDNSRVCSSSLLRRGDKRRIRNCCFVTYCLTRRLQYIRVKLLVEYQRVLMADHLIIVDLLRASLIGINFIVAVLTIRKALKSLIVDKNLLLLHEKQQPIDFEYHIKLLNNVIE